MDRGRRRPSLEGACSGVFCLLFACAALRCQQGRVCGRVCVQQVIRLMRYIARHSSVKLGYESPETRNGATPAPPSEVAALMTWARALLAGVSYGVLLAVLHCAVSHPLVCWLLFVVCRSYSALSLTFASMPPPPPLPLLWWAVMETPMETPPVHPPMLRAPPPSVD